ncbi:MAG: hypothetical protein H6613_18200 [Ignavibacteriales bacterium]|nr:hypothetical protein [Ignavibacteriales bacterium]
MEFYNTNADIADWILLELRTGETPETATTVVGQKACFVKSDGTVIDEDGTTVLEFFGTPPGSYYLVVKHRNHLPVMSPVEVNMN